MVTPGHHTTLPIVFNLTIQKTSIIEDPDGPFPGAPPGAANLPAGAVFFQSPGGYIGDAVGIAGFEFGPYSLQPIRF